METEQAPRSAQPAYSDEIDLVELFQNLWKQKLLIIACTVLVTVAAAVFAFLSTPEYKTKAGVLPPRLSDIAGYNLGRQEASLNKFSVSGIYSIFKDNLLSGTLKRQFFHDVYLPTLPPEKRAIKQDKLWKEFGQILTVKAPDKKNRPEYYEVMADYKSPDLAAEWVNHYIDMVAKKTELDMQKNVLSDVVVSKAVIEKQIDSLRVTAKNRREDRIIRLREALVVAESVGLDAPQVVAGRTSSNGDLAQFIDGNLMYMRGAKAIRAELAVLEKRENDDPFIGELRFLENQLDFLRKIDVNPDDVSVFTLDSRAEVPATPIKPKKALILALGMILGGMLGVLAALIRGMLKKRRVQVS